MITFSWNLIDLGHCYCILNFPFHVYYWGCTVIPHRVSFSSTPLMSIVLMTDLPVNLLNICGRCTPNIILCSDYNSAMVLINFSFNWFIVAIIWNSHIMILHGTKIRTGITCKKICCYMCNSACRWLIVQNAQIFRSYVKQFWIFPHERNCKIFIGLCKYISMNHPILFLDRNNTIKQSYWQFLFLTF